MCNKFNEHCSFIFVVHVYCSHLLECSTLVIVLCKYSSIVIYKALLQMSYHDCNKMYF